MKQINKVFYFFSHQTPYCNKIIHRSSTSAYVASRRLLSSRCCTLHAASQQQPLPLCISRPPVTIPVRSARAELISNFVARDSAHAAAPTCTGLREVFQGQGINWDGAWRLHCSSSLQRLFVEFIFLIWRFLSKGFLKMGVEVGYVVAVLMF